MASIGTIRVVNKTNKQRTAIVTTVVPLPDIAFWSAGDIATGSPPVTAVDPLLSPGNKRVQSYIQGPKYPSGNPKYIRVTLKVEMPAGAANTLYGYQFYSERLIVLTNDVTAGISYGYKSDVLTWLSLLNMEFQFSTAVERTITLPVDMWNTVLGTGLGLEYEQETGHTSEQVIKSWIAVNRDFRTNITTEPSLYLECLFELGSNERHIDFDLTLGNSQIYTGNVVNNHYSRREWALPAPVKLFICGPSDVVIRGEDAKLPKAIETSSNTFIITLLDPSDSRQKYFNDGQCITLRGSLHFNQNATSTELDTLTAEASSEIEAVAVDWQSNTNLWGIHGVLPQRPNNGITSSDLFGRYQAAKQAQDDRAKYRDLRFPYFESIHSQKPYAHSTGNTNVFGETKLFYIARSGQPDFAALRLSVRQEGARGQWHRYVNVVNYLVPSSITGKSGLWTDYYRWEGGPFFGNQAWTGTPLPVAPVYADNLGKGEGLPNNRPISETGQQWSPYESEHYEINFFGAYTLLTGDRWARRQIAMFEEDLMSCLWPVYDNREPASQIITGIQETRGEARYIKSLIWCYLITGNPNLRQRLIDRYNNVIGPSGATPWLGSVAQVQAFKYIPTGRNFALANFGCGSGQNPVFLDTIPTWQHAILVCAYNAVYTQFGLTQYLDLAKKICKFITVDASRNNSSSGGKRQIAIDYCYNAPSGNGNLIPDSYKFNCVSNPRFPTAQCFDWDQTNNIYQAPAAILGYEWAQQANDPTWQNACFEFIRDQVPTENLIAGNWGWGTQYTNNWYEFMAVIDDIFKSRSGTGGTSIVGAPVTFNGQGTLTVTPFLPYTLATVTFNGQATVSAVGTSDNIISGSITFNGQATLSLTGTQVLSSDAVVFFLGSSDLILNPEAYTPPPQRVSYLDVTLDYQTFLQVRIGGPTMTKTGQLVAVWSGDSHLLIYTVRDKDGNLVDLDNSGISEIIWNLANDVNSPTLISKSLTLGGIVKLNQSNFPGMYQVTIEPTDTFILNGKFYFETKLFASNIVLQMDVGTAVIHPSQITRSLTILP